ncbi:putative serine/threonine-protein kinase [Camellia lanceoleosa]|uniref:Serine/threonine-protein kinase n=1 Tax=Camellia lanceoleosa TaxID=1840588 RepID=A0ACC0HE93_9ERIC|nr:putative serine/threonine-protein kinase [Camellia lanceoleosa]
MPKIQIDIGKAEHRVVFSDRPSSGESQATSGNNTTSFGSGGSMPKVSHLGWGQQYTLRELEAATNGLSAKNVIGEGGGYGIVYSGVLADSTRAAVKNLLNNRDKGDQVERNGIAVAGNEIFRREVVVSDNRSWRASEL